MRRRIQAWLNLAYRFNRHVLTRMPLRLLRRGRDYARFRDAVAAEGYVPLDAAGRAALPQFMNCVHCGLCALACPELAATPASAWDEAWTFASGASRALDRAALVMQHASPCTDCNACAAACPTGVPIPLIAHTLRSMGGRGSNPAT
jgi:ferredoxin